MNAHVHRENDALSKKVGLRTQTTYSRFSADTGGVGGAGGTRGKDPVQRRPCSGREKQTRC